MRPHDPDARPLNPPISPSPLNGPAPSALATVPDMVGLLKALRRRWLLACGLALLAGGVAAAAGFILTPQPLYSTQATIWVASTQPKIIFDVADGTGGGNYIGNQAMAIRTGPVLNAALRQEEVAALRSVSAQVDPVDWLRDRLQVGVEGEFIRVGMRGEHPGELAILVNAVVAAYFTEVIDTEQRDRKLRQESLLKTFNDYQDQLREKRRQVRTLAETAGSKDPDTLAYKQQITEQRLSETLRLLADYESQQRDDAMKIKVLEARLADVPEVVVDEAALRRAMGEDVELRGLSAEVAGKVARVAEIKRTTKRFEADPAYRRAQQDLVVARKAMDARRAQVRDRLIGEMTRVGGGADRAELAETRFRARLVEGTIAELKLEAKKLGEASKTQNKAVLDLEADKDEIMLAEKTALAVGQEVEHLKVEAAATARVVKREDARVPKVRGESKQAKVAALAGVAAMVLAMVGVAWVEFRARRVHTVEEVAQGLGIRLLGSLPALPEKVRNGGAGDARGLFLHGLLIESIDAIRTLVLRDARVESMRCLMVASALGGEGKTSLASHLALSFARAGRRTLLVDGDLRRPMANRLFEQELSPGLSDLLRGGAGLAEAIRPTSVNGLSLLPAGKCDATALHALARGDLEPVFARLRDQFDFIIVDSAPVMPVADTLELGQHVDGVVFSILRNVSRMPFVHAGYERLSRLDVRMLGAVVAGIEPEGFGRRHGYGYGYGYGYGSYGYGYGYGYGSGRDLHEGNPLGPALPPAGDN